MVKDPEFDRYAGIESLPGDPLRPKRSRPFRVDEDGTVIYQDEKPGIGRPMVARKARERARAGILDWNELDEDAAGQSPPPAGVISARGLRGPAKARAEEKGVLRTRKTIGGIDYEVISANTYDPALSNGKTAIPNADMIATMRADMNQVAVRPGSKEHREEQEKATSIVRLTFDFGAKADNAPARERNLPLTSPKSDLYYSVPSFDVKTESTRDGNIARFGAAEGAVAFGHGHIDGISDGMIDVWDPARKPKPIIGDVGSLLGKNPRPMATVSEGHMGWHVLDNGRLQFMYPVGSYSEKEREKERRMLEKIQANLDRQQSLFQKKVP